jgi:hypothetical protein
LKYIEFGGSTQDKLIKLKERIVESNPRLYRKDYELPNPIYPIIDVQVLMPVKSLRKESPKESVKSNVTSSKPQTSIYDAKHLGATIAPATYYHTQSQLPASKPYNLVPPPPTSGKNIFYPTSNKPPTTSVVAPPLTPQLPKNIYGKPPPMNKPSVVSPVIRNTWEDQKEVLTGRTSITSPIPPPVPTIMAPSSASASMIKNTPPAIRGRILDQANFGIRAFKQDEKEDELDTSKIPQEEQMIVEFFKQEADLLAQIEQNPRKKQDLDNKIKVLYRRLINKELTPEIINTLKNAIRSILYM